ncbi:glycosyltransferase family 39 protein [Candidatus Woesebacteria bacterium]|nr:MAG: glycosyltransferase family 39 protein [Candidatus Woesebacteria bacterium]
MELSFNKVKFRITKLKIAYLSLISVFLLYLIKDMQFNTAFVDEAIYATIGEEVLRKIYWENAISWMGGSYLYPVISGFINRYYGLEGIRMFSALCVLTAGVLSAKLARLLGGKYSSLAALIFFLFSSLSLNLGQLGTYDTPSLMCMSISFYCVITSRYHIGKRKFLLLILSSFFMTLAVLSKYVAILFVPTIILAIIPTVKNTTEFIKHIPKLTVYILCWSLPFTALVGWYVFVNYSQVINFFEGDFFSEPSNLLTIFTTLIQSTNFIIIGATTSLVYALLKVKGEKKWLVIVLFIGGLAPILYHLSSMNIRSFPKHLVFTLFYWVPLTGWILNKIYTKLTQVSNSFTFINNSYQLIWTTLFILIITNTWLSFAKHWQFQRSWPSSTATLEYLREHRKNDDKIFAEAAAIYKFHMFEGFEDPSAWPSTWHLEYKGKFGVDAMKMAISEKAFDYIILNDYFTSEINREIKPVINEYYEVVAFDDYKLSGVHTITTLVWQPKDDTNILVLSENNDWFSYFSKP